MAIAVIIGLAVLILAHEAGHFAAAKLFGVRVEEFGIGFPPRLFSRRRGETEYSINALPLGGFVRLAHEDGVSSDPRSFPAQKAWKKLLILVAGIVVNIAVAWLLFGIVFSIGAPRGIAVSGVAPDSPAAAAGIKSGDLVTGFGSVDEFLEFSKQGTATGELIVFSVTSGGDERSVVLEGRRNPPEGEGALGLALVGVGFPSLPPLQAFIAAFGATYETIIAVASGIWGLIIGIFSGGSAAAVAGPVGIVAMAADVGSAGFAYLLQLIAVISVNLAILNLIPFPALDGGRAAVVIAETAVRRRVPAPVLRGINAVGFVLLLVLMVLVTIQDISRLV